MKDFDFYILKLHAKRISDYADKILRELEIMREYKGARDNPEISSFVRDVLAFNWDVDATAFGDVSCYNADDVIMAIKHGFNDFGINEKTDI